MVIIFDMTTGETVYSSESESTPVAEAKPQPLPEPAPQHRHEVGHGPALPADLAEIDIGAFVDSMD